MFNRTPIEPTHAEKIIDATLTKLEEIEPGTQDFTNIVNDLEKLQKLIPKKESWMKPELVVPVVGNLVGILAILNYERVHVVSSKALSLLIKTRV